MINKNKKAKINFSFPRILPNSTKALSGVVTAMILIALSIAAIAIVWISIKNMVSDKLEDAGSCFDVGFSDKVKLNNEYTCFNSSDNSTQFSIDIGDIEIDELLISFTMNGESKSLTITNKGQEIKDLKYYNGDYLDIKLPGKNSGITYIAEKFNSKVNSIQISPKINGKQCEVSDSIKSLDDCSIMAN